jgi:hypothetical protein
MDAMTQSGIKPHEEALSDWEQNGREHVLPLAVIKPFKNPPKIYP